MLYCPGQRPGAASLERARFHESRRLEMRVAVVGKGNVGGGLADLWERAGHEVTRIGRDGGDVAGAEAILMAVPGGAVGAALDGLTGIEGRTVIDATNLVGASPPDGFASNAEYVKSRTGGPTAKSFNLNFAAIYDQIETAGTRPGNIWCGDEDARPVAEQLIRDAGYDPINAGGLENAATMEAAPGLLFAIIQGGLGRFFYRMAPPDEF
jgi:predicted dinucleotide-binding enzyme